MAIELITGRAGKAHIGSEDDRAYHAYTNGEGRYILNGGTADIESANNVHIDPVEFLVDGAHVRVTGAGEDVAIENGVASYKRIDVIALHYTRTGNEDNYVESVEFAVIKGANVELGGEPQVPDMPKSGTILAGVNDVYIPVYSILIDGLTPKNLTALLEKYALPITLGGTGVVSRAELFEMIYPVGSIYISYENTSPASLFGGAWTPITGRFPYFDTSTDMGGSNSTTLSVAQLPPHNHQKVGHTWVAYVGKASSNTTGAWQTTISAGSYAIITDGSYTDTKLTGIITGNGDSINNMPAYQTLYAWRRTN